MKKTLKNDTVSGVNEKSSTLGRISDDLRVFGSVRVLCLSAMLCAMSYVLAYLAKMIFGLGPVRFTLENLPIIFGGVSFGPFVGAMIAAAAHITRRELPPPPRGSRIISKAAPWHFSRA